MADPAPTEAPPARPEPPRLLESLGRLFGPFLTLFGSVAAVTAALVFAGFLSDYGAYRLAGLPRLNLNLTGLAEQGADTLIDSLALLAGGMRWPVIALLLLAMLALWGWHDAPRLKPWARSGAVHRAARLLLLVFAVLLTSAMVERAQRSLSGAHHGQQALEDALAIAYDRPEFPTPFDRQLEIERQTYELRVLRPVNLAAHVETTLATWFSGAMAFDGQSKGLTGIALRQLPEARTAARHVYGWLSVLALALCVGVVLLAWWAQALQEGNAMPTDVPGPSPLHRLQRLVSLLGSSADQPIERVLAPLTLLLAMLSVALLPLAHGLLARESLGAETVMVHLDNGPTELKDTSDLEAGRGGVKAKPVKREASLQDPPDSAQPGPVARLDCKGSDTGLNDALDKFRKAQREFLHKRPTSDDVNQVRTEFFESMDAVARAAIATSCADSVAQLWSAMPAYGVRAMYPEVAEAYQQMFRRVQTAYGVRVGTLLGYPRDDDGLTLAESIVPLPIPRGGQAAIAELPRKAINSTEVLPDIELRRLRAIQRRVKVDPDTDGLGELLFAANPDALEIALDLMEHKTLHANASGVGVTSLGRLAGVATIDRPRAATRAIDLLGDLAKIGESSSWLEKTDEVRGTAATAMHLARSPYSSHRFIDAVEAEPIPASGCPPPAVGTRLPLACLPTVPTAAGFLFQDIVSEMQNFRGRPPPAKLTQDRERLARLMMSIIARAETRDDVRGAACTALGFAGKFEAPEALRNQYWQQLLALDPAKAPFSSPVCLVRATLLGLDRGQLRPFLRDVALGKRYVGLSAQQADLHRSMRRTALVALADLGLTGEVDLLFQIYMEPPNPTNHRLPALAAQAMSEASPEPLASKLLDCGLAPTADAERSRHCLEGMTHLDENYDGDEGGAARLHAAIAEGALIDQDAACQTLDLLKKRGSKWVARLPESDPVVVSCKPASKSKGEGPGPSPESDQLMQQLQELLKKAQQNKS